MLLEVADQLSYPHTAVQKKRERAFNLPRRPASSRTGKSSRLTKPPMQPNSARPSNSDISNILNANNVEKSKKISKRERRRSSKVEFRPPFQVDSKPVSLEEARKKDGPDDLLRKNVEASSRTIRNRPSIELKPKKTPDWRIKLGERFGPEHAPTVDIDDAVITQFNFYIKKINFCLICQ